MPYQDWRQQWRKLKAVELLCRKLQVSDVAYWPDTTAVYKR